MSGIKASRKMGRISHLVFFMVLGLTICSGMFFSTETRAEYGDIVLNNYSDEGGIRPVIFPHWFHRLRYACKSCHSDIGFPFKAGGSQVNMLKIINGEYCGACHNGQIAWSVENCDLCHTALPKTPTQIHKSVLRAPK
ncbi:c(7)-type cytochrome triheme domain-containing protein [Kaarinaea lacus]